MPVHKRKPDYNAAKNMQELMDAVCAFYGEPYDDRNPKEKDVSIRDVAAKFNITDMKARKILITANLYSTSTSRKVQELAAAGRTVAEIQEIMKLGRSSVNAYLPYTNNIYNLPDVSIEAERQKQYRVRKRTKTGRIPSVKRSSGQNLFICRAVCLEPAGDWILLTRFAAESFL